MTMLTTYALFGDDIRLAATHVSVDKYFYLSSIVCLAFFTLEIIAQSFVKENYWLNFFFWLDIVSTLSLIPDIGWF